MLIEADKPLSQSLLWQIQNNYFHTAGMQAWQDDIVPHGITCHPFMARAYANLIVAYLQDVADQIAPDQPITVIELGAGSGRLTYHLIHQLNSLPIEQDRFKFVLTDYAPSILDSWQNNPQLQALAEEGILDFALFDAINPAPLQLWQSKEIISPENCKNPVILLANYFFDSLPLDSFSIKDGILHSNLLSLYSSKEENDLTDPSIWDRLYIAYESIPIEQPYENELYNEILADYEQLPDSNFTFSNRGLDCLAFWQAFDNVLLLTADRGHTHAEDLIGQKYPIPNVHGSFSMMVNYHAITEYVERCGGRAFVTPHYQDNIQTLAYTWSNRESEFEQTQLTFMQTMAQNGPNDFWAMRDTLRQQIEQMTVSHFLSLIRWAAYDSALLQLAIPHISNWLAEEPIWQEEVMEAIDIAMAQYLIIQEDDPLIKMVEQLREKL